MQQAYGQTYVEQLLHQIVELLCATGNNGHSAPVYIYFLILCLLYILELFTSDSIIYTNLYLFVYLLIIKMSYIWLV